MNIQEFNRLQRTAQHGAFTAIEFAIGTIKRLPNTTDLIVYSGAQIDEFVVNEQNRTALYTRVVMRNGEL